MTQILNFTRIQFLGNLISMNDLVRDLGLSTKFSEILASGLNEENLLEQRLEVSYFQITKITRRFCVLP